MQDKLKEQKQNTDTDSSQVSTSEAICGAKYRRAFWVLFFVHTFVQQSGISAVLMYINRMLVKINDQTGGDFPISPLMGAYCVGIASCIFAFVGALVVKCMGRKMTFVVGFFGMGFSHILAGIALLKSWYLIGFLSMILYIAFFNSTVGNVAFIYTAEVAVDSAAGITLSVQFFNMIIITSTVEYMIGGFFQVHGTFMYFGTWCIVAGIFCTIFVKETKGLTDLEKKNLYSPAELPPTRIETEGTDRNLETEMTERNQIN